MKQVFTFLLFCISCSVFAQNLELKKAEKHYKNYEHDEAIPLYEAILKRDSTLFDAKINLAECYRKTDQYEKAAYWYSKAIEQDKVKPIYLLFYSKMLLANNECDKANKWMQKYIDETPDEDHPLSSIIDCDLQKRLNEHKEDTCKNCYLVRRMSFNSEHDEIGVNYYKNEIVYTVKEKFVPPPRYDAWHIPDFIYTFYQIEIDTLDLAQNIFSYSKEPIRWSRKKVSVKYNDSNVSITKDGRQFFIVRNNQYKKDTNTILNYKVFHADWIDSKWQNVNGLPFNSDKYSVCYPHISEDGLRLYFASDMPGGFGGYDLYYSTFEDHQWSPPMNLGHRVNTAFDEISPFFNAKNNRLYFASNNKQSLGGYDIFYSTLYKNKHSAYTHLASPMNSAKDDFGFICNENGTHGFIISDKNESETKFDIYEFLRIEY